MNRLKRLRSGLRRDQQLPCLVAGLINVRYLTGFAGSYGLLLLSEKKTYFISDSRYEEYARSSLPPSVTFVLQKGDASSVLKGILRDLGNPPLFIDEDRLELTQFKLLKKSLRGIKLTPVESSAAKMRMIKDEEEISVLRRAAAITDRCFSHICRFIRAGMTEWDISLEIERFYKSNGCRKNSFDSIVASGAGSSMPHYETSMTKKIRKGDPVLIDMGCVFEGYNSDLTRTLFMGKVDPEMGAIYQIVKTAQQRAIKGIKGGVTAARIDRLARGYIESQGFGDNFGHSLGHGLGLEIHEPPAIKDSDDILRPGMVVTIEPGIYLPERGGVRIEDMVLVGRKGAEVLTRSPREIIII